MINRIARVFRHRNVSTGFQAYLNSLQRDDIHGIGGSHGPTMDEAKRDFKGMIRLR